MNNHFGKCKICGKECELTYEHIPPKKAFNNYNRKGYFGDAVIELVTSKERMPWETKGLNYTQMQKGVGLYSLCKECNNYTGSKYAVFYCDFAYKTVEFIDNNFEEYSKCDLLRVRFKPFYPLKFIKQVLSMFCSTTPGLNLKFNDIKDVLTDASKNLNVADFRISMGMVKNSVISWTGCMGKFYLNGGKRVLSEIVVFPFIFILDYDKNVVKNKLIDITYFLKYNYDDTINLDITLPVVERNIAAFPADYRTKSEIINTVEGEYNGYIFKKR